MKPNTLLNFWAAALRPVSRGACLDNCPPGEDVAARTEHCRLRRKTISPEVQIWGYKVDLGIVIHRDPNSDPTRTEVYVRKVRFKSVGKIGRASLRYDPATGRYREIGAE